MIYTSYFGNLRRIPFEVVKVAICRRPPEWYKGTEYKVLAPSFEILSAYKKDNDTEKFTKTFTENILNKLDANEIKSRLDDFANGKDVVLLCFEKNGDFCHRHLVREWLNKNGVPCEEYPYKGSPEKGKPNEQKD